MGPKNNSFDFGAVVIIAIVLLVFIVSVTTSGCATVKGVAHDAAWMFNKVDQSIVQPE